MYLFLCNFLPLLPQFVEGRPDTRQRCPQFRNYYHNFKKYLLYRPKKLQKTLLLVHRFQVIYYFGY